MKMNRRARRVLSLVLLLLTLLPLAACGVRPAQPPVPTADLPVIEPAPTASPAPTAPVTPEAEPDESPDAQETPAPDAGETVPDTEPQPVEPEEEEPDLPDEDGYYYDVESVVLYLDTYGRLPDNFITKKQAQDLGWSGGSVERYQDGAAIGGDKFGNREGILPKANGRTYTECDIDTLGENSRGAKRLVFSSDGLYFYTDDHYEHFTELVVTEGGKVEWK